MHLFASCILPVCIVVSNMQGFAADPVYSPTLCRNYGKYGLMVFSVPVHRKRGYCRDLRAEFSRISLLLIPSLAEPLGRVLYDAAHFGVPIIAADSGGLGEICRLYDVGVSFPAGNAETLAASIENSLNNLPEITATFLTRSTRMVESLKMSSYLDAVRSILLQAADRQPVSIRWTGELIADAPADTTARNGI